LIDAGVLHINCPPQYLGRWRRALKATKVKVIIGVIPERLRFGIYKRQELLPRDTFFPDRMQVNVQEDKEAREESNLPTRM
jgi:hypothetical protein